MTLVPGVRADLVDRITDDTKYVAIVAPPGYGKTVLAREIHDASPPGTAAWLSVDLLDRHPHAFWTHLVASLRGTTATIDDEPLALVAERDRDDLTFAAALSAQVRQSPDRVTLVLDDVDRIDDAAVLAGLECLAEWSDDRLRVVLTGRVDPAFPLARWRARNLLVDVRQDDLRFDREAARRFVDSLAPGLLGPDDVDALTDRVEGWPVAIQVALLVARASSDPSVAVRDLAGTDRLIADYVSVEVLDSLTEPQRDVAFGLSVLEWFDLDLCRDVLGQAAVPVVRELIDRQLLLTELAGRSGFRFHSLVRELLETELQWRDPQRHLDLHRRAGDALLGRGDRFAAMRHLAAAGDHERASAVIAGPAMSLIESGHMDELRRALADLPFDMDIIGPERIIDLAFAEFLAGRRSDTRRWVQRAIDVVPVDDERLRSRLTTLRLAERGAMGDAPSLRLLLDEGDRRRRESLDEWPLGIRHDAIAARASVLLDAADAPERIAAVRTSTAPKVAVDVVVPALQALLAVRNGDLATALERQRSALAAAESLASDDHPAMYEAMLAAGWCAWGQGDFDQTRELGDRAFAHPLCAFPMWWVRVASMVSETLVRTGAAERALELLDHLDPADAQFELVRTYHQLARARALVATGRGDEVQELLAAHPASPERDLLLAWAAVRSARPDDARALLRSSDGWPAHLRIEALVVAASLGQGPEADRILERAVDEARRTGWVAPLIGHGPAIDAALRRAPGSSTHALARALGRREPDRSSDGPIALTERELTLLELLPTHLSYAQMGEQLFLSVNTIKSNLKSVYRKLGASTRDEAIRSAERAGLLGIGTRERERQVVRRP